MDVVSYTAVRAKLAEATLIEDIQRHPFAGLGKPEPLKRNLRGFWSRRITREHRLVYHIEASVLPIAQIKLRAWP